jgi:TonB-dependent SusC/RagA subfamily outer membrane receptor
VWRQKNASLQQLWSLSLQIEVDGAVNKSLDRLLQGNVPGLTAYLPSGLPGVGARIQTRGVKSALGSTNPVIYVDGVRVDNSDNFAGAFGRGGQVSSALADLLVGDNIERIEIIKGGAASTLYGSDGANGVIQIFTKKGAAGEAKWTIGVNLGLDSPELRWLYERYLEKNYFQTPFYQQYRLGVTGGSEALSYNINAKAQDSRGLVIGDRVPDRAFNAAQVLKQSPQRKPTWKFPQASHAHSLAIRC